MFKVCSAIISIYGFILNSQAQTLGWSRLFEDQLSEFQNEELSWEQGGGLVPAWLNGTFINLSNKGRGACGFSANIERNGFVNHDARSAEWFTCH